MKKILLLIAFVLFIVGCSPNKKTSEELFNKLKNDKIIDESLELIDKVTYKNTVMIPYEKEYYVYKDSDSNIIIINYDKSVSNEDYNYTATIYTNIEVNNDIEYVENTRSLGDFYIYSDGSISSENKYILNENYKKTYYIYKKQNLFYKKYIIKEK